MSRVLFCLPPPEDDLQLPKGGGFEEEYGLGIPYLASYLESRGHQVDALLGYFHVWSDYEKLLEDKVSTFNPDIIAIQSLSTNRYNAFRIIKKYHPLIECVIGGHHASYFARQITERFEVKCVIGEGEVTLAQIADGKNPHLIDGITWWDGYKVVTNPPRDLIENLDLLPYPKHSLFFTEKRHTASIITSRGCFFKCSFCSLGSISNNKVRFRSIGNVINEIAWLKRTYPEITNIVIQDDSFTLKPNRVIDLCKRLVELDLGIKFKAAGVVRGNTPEMFEWMVKAGFNHLYVGLETGDPDMLKRTNKALKLDEIEHMFTNLKPYPELMVSTFLITGLPGETWETIENTIKFLKKLQKIRYAYIDTPTIAWAFPGSQLYTDMEKKYPDTINDDYWFNDTPCPNYTVEHSLEELKEMYYYMLSRISFKWIFTPVGFYTHLTNSPLNVLQFMWYHPEQIKYAVAESFGHMFPRLYKILRGYKIQKRFLR